MADRKPLIGLTGRRKKGRDIVGNFDSLAEFDVDIYYADYARAVREAGGIPLHVPLDADADQVVPVLDGLLLSGGTDIDPLRYGHEQEPDCGVADSLRDQHELALLDAVVSRQLPTLGICRGLQIINVHEGGTLFQHVPEHLAVHGKPADPVHEVNFAENSALRGLYGERRKVNSLHHQTVDELGKNLAVAAWSPSMTVEAIEHNELPIIAVQWHPEMMRSRTTDPIFAWLVSSARAPMRSLNR